MTEASQSHNDPGVQLKLDSRRMVHTLNNLLFVIQGYTQIVKNNPQAPDFPENIKQIETALDQIQTLLTNWRTGADKLVPDPKGEQPL